MNISFLYFIAALLMVVTVHEFAHAWMSNQLGDPTARLNGRLSLNPLRHLDPIGTIMLVVVHFGWGKPVPVNPHYFKKPRRDEALTALAGPGSNLLFALVILVVLKYFEHLMAAPVGDFLSMLLDVNLLLFAFNLLPFPPLDGSKIFQVFVPKQFHAAYEKYLRGGLKYFLAFVLIDQYLFNRIFGFSIVGTVVGVISDLTKALLFFGA